MDEEKRRGIDRILIIDDNPSVHEAFLKVLAPKAPDDQAIQELHGALFQERLQPTLRRQFEVDSAFSGEEGLQMVCRSLAEGRPYTVVFVDMYMPPGWGGLQTVSSIWKKSPDLNVVICTAYSEHSWEAVAEYLGDVENLVILRKPFERDEVLQLVHMLSCKSRRLAAQNRSNPAPTAEKFRILMLEDDPITSTLLHKKLAESLPDVSIQIAKTVANAQTLIVQNRFDFYLLDIFLPDGTGIDFLLDVMSKQTEVQAVLMTAQPLGECRKIADQLGVLRLLEKPVSVPQLVGFIKPLLQAKQLAEHGERPSFAATLNQLTTLDVIQLKCLGRASAQLAFTRTDGTQGRVWIHHGEVVHAQAPGKSGEVAFAEIVGWRAGRVEEAPRGEAHPRTIAIPWQVLLLNTVRELDETLAAPSQTRTESGPGSLAP